MDTHSREESGKDTCRRQTKIIIEAELEKHSLPEVQVGNQQP